MSNTKSPKKRTSFTIDPVLLERLGKFSSKNNNSVSAVICSAVEYYMDTVESDPLAFLFDEDESEEEVSLGALASPGFDQ